MIQILGFCQYAVIFWHGGICTFFSNQGNYFKNAKHYSIAIKFLSNIFFPVWIENINFFNAYWNLVWKYLKMSLQYFKEKISFYLNIVCKNIVCDLGLKWSNVCRNYFCFYKYRHYLLKEIGFLLYNQYNYNR